MPSELAGILYKRLVFKYFKFYFKENEIKDDKKNNIYDKMEKWKKNTSKELKKIKGIYYRNVENFEFFDREYENDMNKLESEEFKSIGESGKFISEMEWKNIDNFTASSNYYFLDHQFESKIL